MLYKYYKSRPLQHTNVTLKVFEIKYCITAVWKKCENWEANNFNQTHDLAPSCNADCNTNTNNVSDDTNESDFSSDSNSKQQLNVSHGCKTAAVEYRPNIKFAKSRRSFKCVQNRYKIFLSLRNLKNGKYRFRNKGYIKRSNRFKICIWTIRKH